MASAVNAEQHGAPYAFRCECSEGRAKAQTGIPLWSKRYAAGFRIDATIGEPRDATPSPGKVTKEPEEAPSASESASGRALLSSSDMVTVARCVELSRSGQQLKHNSDFLKLIQKYGKEPVLAAVRSIRLKENTVPVR